MSYLCTIEHKQTMENKTRYIVVVFCVGIACTYQMNGDIHWYFSNPPFEYKKLAYAKKKAEVLGRKYPNCNVCVFKVELNEEINSQKLSRCKYDDNRLMFNFLYIK